MPNPSDSKLIHVFHDKKGHEFMITIGDLTWKVIDEVGIHPYQHDNAHEYALDVLAKFYATHTEEEINAGDYYEKFPRRIYNYAYKFYMKYHRIDKSFIIRLGDWISDMMFHSAKSWRDFWDVFVN